MTSNPAQIDTTIEIITPENIAFSYRVAGPFRRLPAYVIDGLIRVGILWVAMFVGALLLACHRWFELGDCGWSCCSC